MKRKTLLISLVSICVVFAMLPLGFGADALNTETPLLLVTGTGVVEDGSTAPLVGREKSYTPDDLKALAGDDVDVTYHYSSRNSASADRVYSVKGVRLDTVLAASGLTSFSGVINTRGYDGFTGTYTHGTDYKFYPNAAITDAAYPTSETSVPTVLAWEGFYRTTTGGSTTGISPIMVLTSGQEYVNEVNNGRFASRLGTLRIGDALVNNVLTIVDDVASTTKVYTRSELLMMPRATRYYDRYARGVPLKTLLDGVDDDAIITFKTLDDWPVSSSGWTKAELVSKNALVAYEIGATEAALAGIRVASGSNVGYLRFFVDGEQSAQYFSSITVLAPEGSGDVEEFKFEVTVPAGGTFSIPLHGSLNGTNVSPYLSPSPYNWNINWGDGSAVQTIANTDAGAPQNSNASVGIPHTYTSAGTYTIKITPNGSTSAWLGAFGFAQQPIAGANNATNKALVTKVVSPITPLMTRTPAQIEGSAVAPNREWVGTFADCVNLTMGDDFGFSESWNDIEAVGDSFVMQMFFGCNNASFTMGDSFNLPSGIKTAGSMFANSLFASCNGAAFTMNEVFNLPSGFTSVGHTFAQSLFASCYGAAFNMNDVFTFPAGITSVGNSFAARAFYNCRGDAFTMNAVFNLPQTINTMGDTFCQYMFADCRGAAFTMNSVFNLPTGMTEFSGSGGFVTNMFAGCSGPVFNMNTVFNLPQAVVNPGSSFATALFNGCSGNAFTMNSVFNLPPGITTVTSGFASTMFYQCSGNAFTMNQVFNLPSGITAAGATFAYNTFNGCNGPAFKVNNVFVFPTLSESTTNGVNTLNVYAGTFANIGNASLQNRTAASIIGANPLPTANKGTFTASPSFADRPYIHTRWGGDGLEPPVIALEVYDAASSTPSVPVKSFTLAELQAIATVEGSKLYNVSGYNTFPTQSSYLNNTGPTLEGILTAALGTSSLADSIADGYNLTATAADNVSFSFSKAQLVEDRYYYPNATAGLVNGAAPTPAQLSGAVLTPPFLSLTQSRFFIGQLGPSEQTRAIWVQSMVGTASSANIPKFTVNSSATSTIAEDIVIQDNVASFTPGASFYLASAATPGSALNLGMPRIYSTVDGSVPVAGISEMYNYATNSTPYGIRAITAPSTPGAYELKLLLHRWSYADKVITIPFVVPYEAAPTVTSVTPTGTGAATSGNIVITFERAMDPDTAGTVALNGGSALGAGSWSAGNTVYTVAYSGLDHSTEYTVNISGFADSLGAAMVTDGSHSFTTLAAPAYTITITNVGNVAGDTTVSLSASSGYAGDPITLSYVLGDGGGKPINTLSFTGATGLSNETSAGANTSQVYTVNASDVVDGTIAIIATFVHSDLAAQTIAFPNANAGVTKTFGEVNFTNAATLQGVGGEGAITYESSNTSVATVDPVSGEVTIISVGATTITATKAACSEFSQAQASYVLTINKASKAAPQGLSKTDETATAAKDGCITGVDTSMEYSSDGTNYLPVSGSTIVGLAPGTYFVRFCETDTHEASDVVALAIAAYAEPTRYNLVVVSGVDTTASGPYEAGQIVSITADPAPSGKVFAGWTGGNGGSFSDPSMATTVFTMPANDATVVATYKDIGGQNPPKPNPGGDTGSSAQIQPTPKTGDSTSILLWVALTGLSGASLLVSRISSKRRTSSDR